MDPARHVAFTGVPLAPILRNLRALDAAGAEVWLRLPLVPGHNDDEANLEAVGRFVGGLHRTRRIHVLPYHRIASAKYERLGLANPMSEIASPTTGEIERAVAVLGSFDRRCARGRLTDGRTGHGAARAEPRHPASISAERSLILTRFYREHLGRHSTPVLRALAFRELCEHKTITIERRRADRGRARSGGPRPCRLFPELTCHSAEDLRILDSRPLTHYEVPADVIAAYEDDVIPYWQGRSMRDRMFRSLPAEWQDAYEAGLFTEFMEQRAPGHTVADGKIYRKGMLDFKADIDAATVARWIDLRSAGRSPGRGAQGDGASPATPPCVFAERHAELAEAMAAAEPDATPPHGACGDRRRLPPGAGARPARLLGGDADVLVLPPGGDHGAQRVGRLLARAPRPAPAAVL